jgi:endonuclease/exonuclease/phosphatase (EEP) superfamily protein YafD
VATVDEVLAQKPDIVLLQEYAPHFHAEFARRMSEYPHRVHIARWDAYGAAIFSRFPFAEKPAADLRLGPMGHPQMRAVVDVNGTRVAVYNVHLEGPHYLDELAARRTEFADLLDVIRREPLPIIIAGDFNMTMETPQIAALRSVGLRDAHHEAGFGLGITWPVIGWTRYVPVPGVRIDHVLVSGHLAVTSCTTGHGHGSDHRPIIATVSY